MARAFRFSIVIVFALGVLLPRVEHCEATEVATNVTSHTCCDENPVAADDNKPANNSHADCCPDGCACLFVGTSLIFPEAQLISTELVLADSLPHYTLKTLISELHLALPYQPPQA